MKRKNVYKHEVFVLESGSKLLLEKEYDTTGNVLLYASLKLLDYDRHMTLASGEDVDDFVKEIDSYVGTLQALRQELLSANQNPF